MQVYFKVNLCLCVKQVQRCIFLKLIGLYGASNTSPNFNFQLVPVIPVNSALPASLSLPVLSSTLKMWAIKYNEPIQDMYLKVLLTSDPRHQT